MQRYNPKEIEPKWQAKWAADETYVANDDPTKPKRYILEYFPYPSGAAMHVGHVRNYTIGDALSRHARMNGYNVLHPMGWDAFGLPAENYAIKTGVTPNQAIAENTARFKEQLTRMGFGYDWSREFTSSDPEYYKWTQWFFLLLYKRGLAYQKESLQWWCPVDKTVLANEQVEGGKCWRCGSDVEKKALKQWFFKITDYADRLEKDLDDVNWSDSIKSMQRNWIGRSKGAEVTFPITDSDKTLRIFTTRPDTMYGATFMVVAPEHPIIKEITTAQQREKVSQYIKTAQAKTDVERQEASREKTGVFTGAYAVNPVNKKKIPVWVADYVLYGYGTGAIMAVPAHDERDHEFAKRFNLPIIPVVSPTFFEGDVPDSTKAIDRPTVLAVAHDPEMDLYCILKWHEGQSRRGLEWPGGGIDTNESIEDAAIREFTEETGYTDVTVEKILPTVVSLYFPIKELQQTKRAVKSIVKLTVHSLKRNAEIGKDAYEKDAYDVHWLTKEQILASDMHPFNVAVSAFAFDETIHVGEGTMINSDGYDNMSSDKAREQIIADLAAQGAGKERVNYKIRDWLISRQRYWGAPIPMVYCPACGTVPVPEDQLPVTLPDIQSFEPSGDGRSPLARVPEFVNTICPHCGGGAERETDTMDGFACSSWYFLRFADPHNTEKAFDAEKIQHWLPVDDYIGGAEHAVMHLLYARMWTKVMQDASLISFGEPFKTLRNHGMILAPDGQKMSKSKGNTIEPDVLIEQGYGADAIRIMELFIGPWNQAVNWSVEGMGGSFRFLQRIWALVQDFNSNTGHVGEQQPFEADIRRATHKAIKTVSIDLESLSFNTAIAALMEFVNELYKLKMEDHFANLDAWRGGLEALVQLLAPFAPHISEELWQQLGHESSIHTSKWPAYNEQYLISDTMTIVVQVNGKLRVQLQLPTASDEDSVKTAAVANERVQSHIADSEVIKTIYVPGKLVNIVTKKS